MGTVISHIFNKKQAGVKMAQLSPNDISIIKTTWEIPKQNPLDSGEAILLRFFEKYPHNQDKFNAFKNTPLLLLKGTPGFRTHAGRLITVFDNAITVLGTENDSQQLQEIWEKVGVNHYRRRVSKKAFNEVREIILEVLSGVCNLNDEQKQSWNILFDNVYFILFTTMDKLEAKSKAN